MMKTEELFREDSLLAECDAQVIGSSEGGVILDRTVFYPLGGGQAGDVGTLRAADGREFVVVDTRKSKEHPGAVLHVLAESAAMPEAGARVVAAIDMARRHAHMRFHTARTCCAPWCRTRWTAARSPPATPGWTST